MIASGAGLAITGASIVQSGGTLAAVLDAALTATSGDALQTGGELAAARVSVLTAPTAIASFGAMRGALVAYTPGSVGGTAHTPSSRPRP